LPNEKGAKKRGWGGELIIGKDTKWDQKGINGLGDRYRNRSEGQKQRGVHFKLPARKTQRYGTMNGLMALLLKNSEKDDPGGTHGGE